METSTPNTSDELFTNEDVVERLLRATTEERLNTAQDLRVACKRLFPDMEEERHQACLTLLADRLFSERGGFTVPPIRQRPRP